MNLAVLARLPREMRDTLFLLLVIGWIIAPQAGTLPIWASALAAGVLLWRGWLAVSGRPLPRRWALAALLAVTLAATWATHHTLAGREAGSTLVVMLLTLKTLELRARRDALVVFFLGFFVMLTNFFYSQSLPIAAAMLAGLLGLLTALVNAHRPVGQPSLRDSAWTALKMTLAGAPVMLALFVFFPRFAPLWGVPSDAMQGRSGLSSSMEVGALAALALDDGIVMRVKFDGPPPQSQLYFRGPVLVNFDGKRWTAPGGGDGFEATIMPAPGDLQVSGEPLRYEVTLEPSRRPWLLTLDAAPRQPELPAGQRVRMTADLQWLSYRPLTDLLRYRAESYPQFRYGLTGWDHKPRRDLSAFLRLPGGYNPRTLALADELRRQQPDGDALALARAALERLRTGGYSYTLEPGVAGRDSADTFWFDAKAGFCEHIASAFVVLMRDAGVPARIVTGFQGGEINGVDGYWTVRNADAHAWAEIWVADRGWVRVDPTGAVSPGRIGQFQRLRLPEGMIADAVARLSPTLLAQLRAAWEAVNNGWNQWVLNYTQTRQFDMLRNLGFSSPSWQDLGRVLGGLLAASALIGIAWAYWERRRHDPWLRLLARARQRLAQAGVDTPPKAPPRELLRRVQASALPGELRRPLAGWLLALEQWRYAPAARKGGAAALAKLQRDFRRFQWKK
ncbi:MAG: transglutaminaseTgpA domain-containing protein [Desulfovibrionaceae bacterium]|nr:transglutaminaseTgpA domain-containing protein [Desulfovibrionaceae bacterium]